MMNKEIIKYKINSNARGAPELKLRDGPSLMKTRGAPDWFARGTPFLTESRITDSYLRDNRIWRNQLIKLRGGLIRMMRGDPRRLLCDITIGFETSGKSDEVEILFFNWPCYLN